MRISQNGRWQRPPRGRRCQRRQVGFQLPVALCLVAGFAWSHRDAAVVAAVIAKTAAATPAPAAAANEVTTESATSKTAATTGGEGPAANAAASPNAVASTSWASFRNGNAQRGIATSPLPEELELLWTFPTADGWVASVAIVDNEVYAPALTGYVYCIDRRTGTEIWKYRSVDDPNPKTFAPGFKAAPRVTADTVYAGDEDGVFHAIDRKTGKRRWQLTTDAEIAGCAALIDDEVIIGSHDSNLYCLKTDGTVVWKFQTDDRINCSPAIAGNFTFVAGCDEHLRVIDIREGKQQADIPLETYLIASPAVVDNMLYVGTYAAEVVAVDWQKREIVWRYKDSKRNFPYHASAAVTDKSVIVGGQDKQMHCIDRATGTARWVFPTNGQINSSAAVVGNRVYFGSNDGNLYGLDVNDGREIWKFNAGGDITAGVAVGEECLVVGEEGTDGKLYCFGAKSRLSSPR